MECFFYLFLYPSNLSLPLSLSLLSLIHFESKSLDKKMAKQKWKIDPLQKWNQTISRMERKDYWDNVVYKQCDQIGLLLKCFGLQHFLSKVAQIPGGF